MFFPPVKAWMPIDMSKVGTAKEDAIAAKRGGGRGDVSTYATMPFVLLSTL